MARHVRWLEEMYQTKGIRRQNPENYVLTVTWQTRGDATEALCVCILIFLRPLCICIDSSASTPPGSQQQFHDIPWRFQQCRIKNTLKNSVKVTCDFEARLLQVSGSWRGRQFGISRTGCPSSLAADGLFFAK